MAGNAPRDTNRPRHGKKPRRELSFKARNPAKTKERILKAAIKEFSLHGFKGARVEKIAKRANANMRMLYHYFVNKEKLYVAVLEHMYARVRTQEQELDLQHLEPEEGMRRLIDFTFEHFVDNPDLINLVMGENLLRAKYIKRSELIAALTRPLQESLRHLLARAAKTGVFRPGVDPAQLWLTIFSLCWVHLSNRHTLSWMLQDDLADADWLRLRRDHVKEVVLDYLAA
ncbi:MAG: TetR/AcrR family transcriptional regulator [Rhodospirillales bacterium]|jgi:AcrR family transcriptional regulator|nr:TetR/AcrR family transcriptional regulator [Rhodospirillales bacterium]MDP6773090.1 TetR/AcrR family transcriptional regulator [Rhodospirillales bacterium]|tara:strand:+ start:195 stop:881 length:687 start_codon:yes stop_codon:yes gene_type:complete